MKEEHINPFLSLGIVALMLSIGFHILSCICLVGDVACVVDCNLRLKIVNIVGVVGAIITLISFVLLFYTKKIKQCPSREQP